MIPPLISFDLAKRHVHIIDRNDLDTDIETKIRLASAIVANHCKLTSIPNGWIVSSSEIDRDSQDLILFDDDVIASPPLDQSYIRVPGNLQAAVLLVFGDLFENRESSTSGLLSDTVINLLAPFRDPTMA